jgi:hypothetical protein
MKTESTCYTIHTTQGSFSLELSGFDPAEAAVIFSGYLGYSHQHLTESVWGQSNERLIPADISA